jgi:hypothetical protein
LICDAPVASILEWQESRSKRRSSVPVQIDFLQRSGIAAARLYVAPERFNDERFLGQLARTRISLRRFTPRV